MTMKRLILEIGMGNDLHGGDYTKAASRAVLDAVHHSSMTMVRSLKLSWDQVEVRITVGVQQPESVDAAAVAKTLSSPNVKVTAVKGGLDITDAPANDRAVIATAAVEVFADLPD